MDLYKRMQVIVVVDMVVVLVMHLVVMQVILKDGRVQSHPSGSWVYAIFIFHAAHVLGGIIALVRTLIRSLRGRYTVDNYQGVDLTAIYWHFVDLLWVYLYVFLSVMR